MLAVGQRCGMAISPWRSGKASKRGGSTGLCLAEEGVFQVGWVRVEIEEGGLGSWKAHAGRRDVALGVQVLQIRL